jgi:outer membrane protein assembly factor BamB
MAEMTLRCLIGSLTLAGAAFCGDWSGFRGPNASGIADSAAVPVEFGPSANVVWKTPMPLGSSSPVLTKDRIFLTGYDNGNLLTLCLNRADGKVLWRRSAEPSWKERRHKLNTPSSATPVTDGENVYAFFPEFGLISYGGDGQERWRLPLAHFTNPHGMAASPVLFEDKLILVCDQDNGAYLMAVDRKSGRTAWKTERPEVVHGFATPVFLRMAGQAPQLIVPGSYQVAAYSPVDGSKLWWVTGITWQVKPTAVVSADTVFVSGWAPGADEGQRASLPPFAEALKSADKNGDGRLSLDELPTPWKPTGSWDMIDMNHDGSLDAREWAFFRARRASQNVTIAVRPGQERGDLTDKHVLWTYDRSVPQVSSPLLYKGVLYTVKDGGILTALDPERGTVLKQARLRGAIDAYYSSPVAADGKVFLVSEQGKVSVVSAAGANWDTLAVADMEELCYATPAIDGGRIYLRTHSSLYCFGK